MANSLCKRIQWDVIKLEEDMNVLELKSHQEQGLTSIAVQILQIPVGFIFLWSTVENAIGL